MKPLLAALRFLTIVPLPGTWGTDPADLARSVPWFPVVGLLLGGIAALVAWGASLTAPPLVAALAVIVLLMAFSGCLHLDGLSDTADGFLSSRDRQRILEIMKDSHAGAMGVIAIVVLLLAKFAALASLPARLFWVAALLMPLAGRSAMVLHIVLLPYARPSGLGAVFYERRSAWWAVWSACGFAVAAYLALGTPAFTVLAVWLITALLLALYSRRKIGGATGDTLGAACEILEAVTALTLALWPVEAVR